MKKEIRRKDSILSSQFRVFPTMPCIHYYSTYAQVDAHMTHATTPYSIYLTYFIDYYVVTITLVEVMYKNCIPPLYVVFTIHQSKRALNKLQKTKTFLFEHYVLDYDVTVPMPLPIPVSTIQN